MRTFLIFCLVVFLLIATSLFFKLVSVVQNSTFDGDHRFTLLITYSPKDAEIISFEPLSKTISRLSIRSQNTLPALGKFLGVAIDGSITDTKRIDGNDEIAERLRGYAMRFEKGSLTRFDLLRLYLFAQSVGQGNIEARSIDNLTNTADVSGALSELFYDSAVQDEKVSVEIVNASGVTGRGTALERVLVNMGANVVQVTSSPKDENTSSIRYIDKEAYTIKRITKLLGYPQQQSDGEGLSDIIVTIGKDSITHKVF